MGSFTEQDELVEVVCVLMEDEELRVRDGERVTRLDDTFTDPGEGSTHEPVAVARELKD